MLLGQPKRLSPWHTFKLSCLSASRSGLTTYSQKQTRFRHCLDQISHSLTMNIQGMLVSVSAMPPCTQSFIPLPLPHEYNLNDMIASKRYESVWNTFLQELTRDSAVTLSSLQKKWHVNRSGMKQWMRNNGLSVKEAKKHIHECRHYAEEGQMLPLPATAGNLFLPMTTDQPALQPESCDILSGVSLVFPDGTQVNIRRGSAQAVMSFLKLYQREDLPCLD